MESEGKIQQGSKPKYECLLFDLDDTLYPLSSGLAVEVTKNIQEYMLKKLGIEEKKVAELCVSLYKHYGTTLAGLKAIGYSFDPDDFHREVHGKLPYTMLKPDPVLRSLLLSLPQRKIVFTNADEAHAAKVLSRLGLEDCFEGIICFENLNPSNKDNINISLSFDTSYYNSHQNPISKLPKTPVVCKPLQEAFQQVFKLSNINPQKTLFLDDSLRNLQTGKLMGLHTVWVGNSHRDEGVDIALEHIHNILEALPDILEAAEKDEDIRYSGKIAIETSVRA